MEDVDFSDEFCRFIQSHVPSVDVAEALLAQYRLHNMVRAAGFSEDELARHLATLAQAYEQRPVTLVRLIYALRDRKIRSFADAFRLRKD
jgi:hypothetical protein